MHSGVCFLCGKTGVLEDHHVFGGPFRAKSERYGLKVGLCGISCHREGKRAVHQCRETAVAIKQYWQIRWMMEYQAGVSDFIREFGKNYLELEYYDDERSFPMNITAQSGRLTRDPVLRYTPDQKPVATFTIAVDRPGTRDKTDFFDCIAWDKKAEFVSRNFKKGQRIEVSGILTTRTYEKDGSKRKVVEIRCDQVFFGDTKKEDKPPKHSEGESAFNEINDDDGELPF